MTKQTKVISPSQSQTLKEGLPNDAGCEEEDGTDHVS